MQRHRNRLVDVSAHQMEALISYMEDHTLIARQQIMQLGCQGNIVYKKLWGDLEVELNNIGPYQKTTDEWKVIWRRLRLNAKHAKANYLMSYNKTGHTNPESLLDPFDERICSIFGDYGNGLNIGMELGFLSEKKTLGEYFEDDDPAITHNYTDSNEYQCLLDFLQIELQCFMDVPKHINGTQEINVKSMKCEAVNHLNYFYGTRPQNINALNQFFMVLIILRRNKAYFEISLLFNTDIKQVVNIFTTWITFMKLQWSEVPIWPSKDLVQFYMPDDFYNEFPSTRAILDGTEIAIKKPGLPLAQQCTFSTYKNKSTVKAVIFASPGGLISHVSPIYGGSTTDRQIVERSDIIKMCDLGDSLMADKGFDVQDLLAAYAINLNIPAFFKKRNQLSGKTIAQNKKISSKRVHIERLIGLGKTFKILEGPLDGSHVKLADEIVFVCYMLCNFRRNIITQSN